MKICIYGAGAIGGLLGAHLANKGAEVSVVEVGPTLAAIQAHGLRVQEGSELVSAPVTAVSDPAALGPQDLIIIAVKGQTLNAIAPRVAALLGPQTVIMTAMNGVPWWFFEGFGGEYAGMQLKSIDPDGSIAANIPSDRIIDCVVNLSCSLIEPGVVKHVSGKNLTIGEPSDTITDRLRKLSALLTTAGFNMTMSSSIRKDIWFKVLGTLTHNPISAITGATVDRILNDPQTRELCVRIMTEAGEVGKKIGCALTETPEQRNETTRKLGAFKTSMLQDVEAKKTLELDALVGVVSEIGRKVDVPTPFTDALIGLVRVKAQVLGLYPETR